MANNRPILDLLKQKRSDNTVYDQLREAELQAASTAERRSHEEVIKEARALLNGAKGRKRL